MILEFIHVSMNIRRQSYLFGEIKYFEQSTLNLTIKNHCDNRQ